MVIFSLAAVFGSAYTKAVASFIAGSAAVRAWFNKEIKASRVYFAEVGAKVAVDAKKVETAVKSDASKIVTDIKKI